MNRFCRVSLVLILLCFLALVLASCGSTGGNTGDSDVNYATKLPAVSKKASHPAVVFNEALINRKPICMVVDFKGAT